MQIYQYIISRIKNLKLFVSPANLNKINYKFIAGTLIYNELIQLGIKI